MLQGPNVLYKKKTRFIMCALLFFSCPFFHHFFPSGVNHPGSSENCPRDGSTPERLFPQGFTLFGNPRVPSKIAQGRMPKGISLVTEGLDGEFRGLVFKT